MDTPGGLSEITEKLGSDNRLCAYVTGILSQTTEIKALKYYSRFRDLLSP